MCKIMAFMAVDMGLGLLFDILLGFGLRFVGFAPEGSGFRAILGLFNLSS